jgi:hypothetical protein
MLNKLPLLGAVLLAGNAPKTTPPLGFVFTGSVSTFGASNAALNLFFAVESSTF